MNDNTNTRSEQQFAAQFFLKVNIEGEGGKKRKRHELTEKRDERRLDHRVRPSNRGRREIRQRAAP